MRRKNKLGQMTIFIIMGVALILLLLVFFALRSDVDIPKLTGQKPEKNPSAFLKVCIEDDLRDFVEYISLRGGYSNNPLSKEFMFSEENVTRPIAYLCYTPNYYLQCKNQEPLLINHLNEEIKANITPIVRECFDELTASLEDEGYVVDARYNGFDTEMVEGKIIVDVYGKITLTKSGETSNEENFRLVYASKFYDLAVVAHEIVSQEAKFCSFNYQGFMAMYPENKISKFTTADSEDIYTIENLKTKERFRFIVRSCALP